MNLFADVPGVVTKIKSFVGEVRFLSNFHESRIIFDGIEFPTVEHAFQAAKTLDFPDRVTISQLDSPGKAKRIGRQVALRPDWEEIKEQIMLELIILKFVTHRRLKEQLLATGTAELIEGNSWGDTHWGVCKGVGRNELGKILMLVRDQLK